MSRYSFAALAVIFALATSGVFADDEALSKKLLGRWEGTVAVKGNESRSLIISSVRREGNDLIAQGTFGRGNPQPVEIKIVDTGSEVILSFDAASNEVNLKLVSDREMEGTYNHAIGRHRSNASAKFKKVD